MELSTRNLEQALLIRRQIDALEKRLRAIVGGATAATAARRRGRRQMSPTARGKIAAAARARWARIKSGRPGKKRGGITAAGRRRLSQLMKARWAARRKSKSKKSGTGHTGPKRSE